MKKIISLVIVALMALLVMVRPTYASLSTTNNIADELQWQRITLDGKYAIRTLRFQVDFADVAMEFSTTMSGWENFIVQENGSTYSRVDIYANQSLGTPIETYNIVYEEEGVTEILFLSDGNGNWNVDVSEHTGKWMQITLMLDPSASVSLINNVEYWINNYRTMYDFTVDVRYEVNDYQTIEDLPFTAGNPQQETPGKIGVVTNYFYDSVANTFFGTVNYNVEYPFVIRGVDFNDDDFLDSVASINYYSIGEEKFFQFDFVDSEEVVLTLSGEYATTWSGFAIWNITTNEFVLYNRALAMTYIDVEPDRDVYGYLYLPNIPIDDLLSVSGFFSYRFGYKNIIGQQKYHEWEEAAFVLEKDQASYGSDIFNYGVLPQWTYDAVKIVSFTNPLAALFTLIPGMEDVGYFLNYTGRFSGYLAFALSSLGGIDKAVTGKIDEIETISPDIVLRSKLNEYYSQAADELIVLPTDVDIHKLYFGSFTSYNTNVVDIDESTLTYTEITWVTKGNIYTVDGEFIDEISILDPEDVAPPEDTRDPLAAIWDFIKSALQAIFSPEVTTGIKIIIIAVASAVVIWLGVSISKLFKKAKKISKQPGALIAIGVIIIGVLVALGYIIF
jgi:hypothetical protein